MKGIFFLHYALSHFFRELFSYSIFLTIKWSVNLYHYSGRWGTSDAPRLLKKNKYLKINLFLSELTNKYLEELKLEQQEQSALQIRFFMFNFKNFKYITDI